MSDQRELPDGAGGHGRPIRARDPFGASAEFVKAVRRIKGDAYVQSWLSRTCQFDEFVIWTSDFGRDRLNHELFDLIRDHEIAIRSDEQSRTHFRTFAETVKAA